MMKPVHAVVFCLSLFYVIYHVDAGILNILESIDSHMTASDPGCSYRNVDRYTCYKNSLQLCKAFEDESCSILNKHRKICPLTFKSIDSIKCEIGCTEELLQDMDGKIINSRYYCTNHDSYCARVAEKYSKLLNSSNPYKSCLDYYHKNNIHTYHKFIKELDSVGDPISDTDRELLALGKTDGHKTEYEDLKCYSRFPVCTVIENTTY